MSVYNRGHKALCAKFILINIEMEELVNILFYILTPFIQHKSAVDQLFSIHQLMETCWKFNRDAVYFLP